jgi:4,5-dihydroxyphthalate decarboxylase
MAAVPLTLALGHYDRHVPFFDGSIAIDGVDLTVLNVDSNERHERMLQHGAYDVAEVSLSSYLVARDQGLPFTAIPVFPRRLFSQSQMYRNLACGVESPRDLAGRRVGLSSYQTTLCVLAKGDLAHEYGVPWKEVRWVVGNVDTVEINLPSDVMVERAPKGADLGKLLAEGDLSGLLVSRLPRSFAEGDPRVGRLFPEARAEEQAYFARNGFFPIMHLVAFRSDVLEQEPWLAGALVDAFGRAHAICQRHWEDPNWSRLAWGRQLVEDERAAFVRDPWENGVAANRANLERFISYAHEQGLIQQPMPVESLFAASVLS